MVEGTVACMGEGVCATTVHPVIELFLRDPAMVIHVLQRLLGWELEVPTRALPADVGDTQLCAGGREWCADLAFELRRLEGGSSWLALVAPAQRDEFERGFIWPCYAALLGVRRGGPGGLLAVVPTPDDLTWARQTSACRFGALTFTPLAITIDQLYALQGRLSGPRGLD